MVKEFLEGEVYRNTKLERDIMVYAIGLEDAEKVILAVGFVDRESEEMAANGELIVKKSEYGDWEVVT